MVFPANFLWGASISGFQFEMGDSIGCNVDSGSDWYLWVHDPVNIRKGTVSGDMPENGVNHWNLYEKDSNMARAIGFNGLRIGIEWSRVFPKKTADVETSIEKEFDEIISRIEVSDSLFQRLEKGALWDLAFLTEQNYVF